MKVTKLMLTPMDPEKGEITITKSYLYPDGLDCKEVSTLSLESDYQNGQEVRYSTDNGKTFTEWKPIPRESYSVSYGPDERIGEELGKIYNPHHNHYVSTWFTRYFLDGHEESYRLFWREAKMTHYDHQYLRIYKPNEDKPYSEELLKYEDGSLFDPSNPRNMDHLINNRGFANYPTVLSNGDIAVPVGVPIEAACRIAGIDVKSIFPSCPQLHRGVMVARGHFNEQTERYEFTYSNPVILGDLRSSRGIDEPEVVELKSGRLLMVMRGSNVRDKDWSTRIEPGTPSFKWYSYSDDGGKTFSNPEPWHFDDNEVVYSAATISHFIRLNSDGNLYWIGNISSHTAYGNFPRYPLYVCRVNETYGTLMKNTLTVIDTKEEGQSEKIQLSNFSLLENRETGCLEVSLCKMNPYDGHKNLWGPAMRYIIDTRAD